ncbi:T cell receptor alpha chain%2C partial, partial [Scomber scombrus]
MMLTFHTGSSEDLLKPLQDVMLALEGDNVTLSCKYSGSVHYLYWYQQKSSSSPHLLIREYQGQTGLLLIPVE